MEESSLKVVFSEILRGHTLVSSPKHGDVKIKHFNNFDSAELDIKSEFFYQKAVKDGLPTRKDRIDYLLKEKIWTPERNKEIIHLKSFVKGLKNSKSKVFLKAHIDQINTQINENQLKLSKMELEKEELIGFCAESYASRRINEHYMFNALCDEKNEKLFTEQEFEELAENELIEYIALYNKSTKKFKHEILQKISVSGFFTNLFYLCDNNAHVFFGKPLVELTFYQIELFGSGRYFKSLMEQSDANVPEEIKDNPEKIIEWFDSTKSAKEVLDKSRNAGQDGSATTLVGATKQDLERLGLSSPEETVNLAQKAAEKGGKLTMQDMMKIHGT